MLGLVRANGFLFWYALKGAKKALVLFKKAGGAVGADGLRSLLLPVGVSLGEALAL